MQLNGDGTVEAFFFLGVQTFVTYCARNLAKSTTKYYVTVYGLENYIMAFIRLHFKKRNPSKLIEVLADQMP